MTREKLKKPLKAQFQVLKTPTNPKKRMGKPQLFLRLKFSKTDCSWWRLVATRMIEILEVEIVEMHYFRRILIWFWICIVYSTAWLFYTWRVFGRLGDARTTCGICRVVVLWRVYLSRPTDVQNWCGSKPFDLLLYCWHTLNFSPCTFWKKSFSSHPSLSCWLIKSRSYFCFKIWWFHPFPHSKSAPYWINRGYI